MSGRRTLTLPDGSRVPLATIRRLIAEQRQPPAEQPTLFELRHDARPAGERTAAERYAAPSLFAALDTAPAPHRCGRCSMTVPDARGLVPCWRRDCAE